VTSVLLSIGVAAALQSSSSTAPLDPDSATPAGSLALANLLEDRGVSVKEVHTLAEASAANETQTLLILNTSLISDSAGQRLVETAAKRTVVVGADGGAASLVTSSSDTAPAELTAECRLPEARFAESATFADQLISGTTQHCFPGTSGSGLLFEATVFVLADGSAMMNQNLTQAGNAALSLNLLSATDEVIWFIPSPADLEAAAGSTATLTDLLPTWLAPVLLQALLIFGVLALWKSRRLGPLIREPLPIVVPAHETAEGYAGLLQRNKQAGVAAAVLREASMARLAAQCGLPVQSSPELLVGALAARLGQPAELVADVLWGRRIKSDTGLAKLNLDLTKIEEDLTTLEESARPENRTDPKRRPARDANR
jgi:hypothetical protein